MCDIQRGVGHREWKELILFVLVSQNYIWAIKYEQVRCGRRCGFRGNRNYVTCPTLLEEVVRADDGAH